MNRFIYHYCAHYQDKEGRIIYIDGIMQRQNKIICMDDYRKIKSKIEPEHYKKLVVDSLSFLGMEEED